MPTLPNDNVIYGIAMTMGITDSYIRCEGGDVVLFRLSYKMLRSLGKNVIFLKPLKHWMLTHTLTYYDN
jgi:hypothetical protein